MKALLVGDPHVVTPELEDAKALLRLVVATAHEYKVTTIMFMGDLHHNHRLIDVDVLAFWHDQLQALTQEWHTVALVGNHDKTGDASNPNHALIAYRRICNIIERPTPYRGAFLAVPYMSDPAKFAEAVNQSDEKTILCHQTFNGAVYENGFYAAGDADAIDPSKFPDRQFISGHIHRPQRFGNVTYIGAPRWRSVADANTERGLVVYNFEEGQPPAIEAIVNTATHCRPLYQVTIVEDDVVETPHYVEGARYIVDIFGSQDFIRQHSPFWKEKGARVRTFPTKNETPRVRESQGIRSALTDFINGFAPIYGTTQDELRALCDERLGGLL